MVPERDAVGSARRVAEQGSDARRGGIGINGTDEMHPCQDSSGVDAVGFRGLWVGLVVDREVVEDVLRMLAVHTAQPVADDVRDFVAECRVVGHDAGVGRGE